MKSDDDGERHPRHLVPYVREELDARSLHFSMSEIQSRMQILRPDALELEYTRTMMGFLLFRSEPEHIAMIGLGGGSLAKFCYRHLPRATLTVVEINPHVIALREAFQVPRDDLRFHVIEADGARFVGETDRRFDVLMVDAFVAHGMPAALGTQRFYDDCLDVLDPGGLMAVNLHSGDAHFAIYLERIRRSFGGHAFQVSDSDGTNSVVFAGKGDAVLRVGSRAVRATHLLGLEIGAQLQDAFARVTGAARRAAA